MEEGKQSIIVAQRGRSITDENRNDYKCAVTVQRLEVNNDGITNTLTSVQKDNYVMEIKSNTKIGFEVANEGDSINFSIPTSKTRRGRVGKGVAQTLDTQSNQAVIQINKSLESHRQQPYQQNRVYSDKGLSPTIDQAAGRWSIENATNIRRLTMVECERLQGFEDHWTKYGMYPKGKVSQVVFNALSNIDKIDYINTPSIEKAIPKTARYKLCGNAVTKSIVELIANKLISK